MENVNRHIHLAHDFRAKNITKKYPEIDCMGDLISCLIFIMMKAYCTKSINLFNENFGQIVHC